MLKSLVRTIVAFLSVITITNAASADECVIRFSVQNYSGFDSAQCFFNYSAATTPVELRYQPNANMPKGFDPVVACISRAQVAALTQLLETNQISACREQPNSCDGYSEAPRFSKAVSDGRLRVNYVKSGNVPMDLGGTYLFAYSCPS